MTNYFVEGLQGSGKTTLAGKLAEKHPDHRALAEGEIPFDRKRFSPHITLIRKASKAASGIVLPPAAMTVERLSLMRSDRGRNGMIYTEIGAREAEG